ncbi:hypothetical protein AC622_03275 [Bacillus sp. FJAT-27916]|uniref:hypothetical protein n=1 Tax=Bacillus sp. FJAT-27916 TaxID=1679169 RepID=UPI0006712514|nr:hypothetical protein [Bacillus sp. FJAT-27916]KMY43394.1 hypothetical protein AC622_03275 [Bacillus sp. FJAT-27916]
MKVKKSVYSLVFISCLVSFLPLCANAETKEDIEGEIEQLRSAIQELSQQEQEKCQEFDVENLECARIKGSMVGKANRIIALEQRLIEIENNEANIGREADIAEKQQQDEVEKENREEKRLYKLIGVVFVGLLLIAALFLGSLYVILKKMRK